MYRCRCDRAGPVHQGADVAVIAPRRAGAVWRLQAGLLLVPGLRAVEERRRAWAADVLQRRAGGVLQADHGVHRVLRAARQRRATVARTEGAGVQVQVVAVAAA